jgi:hypothetical protein
MCHVMGEKWDGPDEKISCTSVVENEQPRGKMHAFLFRRFYQGQDRLDTGRDGAC